MGAILEETEKEIYDVCLEKRNEDGDMITSNPVYTISDRNDAIQNAKKLCDENNYYFVTIETWDKNHDSLLKTTLKNQY